ncbi:MAG: cysteine-rich CWC family protein [Parahaliea sp.]
MKHYNTAISASICPRCRQDNQCAMAANKSHNACWCLTTPVNPEHLVGLKGDRCICPQCGGTDNVNATQKDGDEP